MGTVTAALAALPGVAGAVASQVPVGDLVSAAGQALLLCAIAQEYGVGDVDDQVELVAGVVLGRTSTVGHGGRAQRRSAQDQADELVPELAERSSSSTARALATGLGLVRMGRSLTSLHDELDERPRGHAGQRMAGALPVVGLVGQFRGERRGLRIAAERGREWCEVRRAQGGPVLTGEPDATALAAAGVPIAALPAAASPPARHVPASRAEPRSPGDMSREELTTLLRSFGEARRAQGDRFEASRFVDGHYFYETGDQRISIVVWGADDAWQLSVFACARVGMRPTYELYRYVSRWRSTTGIGAPYVVEDGNAAVVCETTLASAQLVNDVSAWRLVATTIDLVGGMSQTLAADLAGADGTPFTAEGEVGLALMLGWWEVRDPRIERLVGAGAPR